MTKKVSARGRRKSIVAQYKAKAKGAPDKPVKKPTKKQKEEIKKEEKLMEMVVGKEKFSVGDFAYFVDEYNASPSRPKVSTGELISVHPEDRIEPCVSLTDAETGKYRVVRSSLIGWSKKEAITKYKKHLTVKKKK